MILHTGASPGPGGLGFPARGRYPENGWGQHHSETGAAVIATARGPSLTLWPYPRSVHSEHQGMTECRTDG